MRTFGFCKESSAPSPERTSTILEEMHSLDIEALFNGYVLRFLKPIIVLGTISFLASISRILESGWHPNYLLQLAVLICFYTVFLFRRHLPKRAISLSLLASIFTLGTVGLLSYGLAGAGLIALIAFCLFTGIIYGFRWGMTATGTGAVVIVVAGVGTAEGVFPFFAGDMTRYLGAYTTWLSTGTAFVVLAFTLLFYVRAVHEHLIKTIKVTQAERDFTKSALDAQKDLFVVYDRATKRPIRWNNTARHITGYTDDEIARSTLPDGFSSIIDRDEANSAMSDLIDGHAVSREIPVTTRTGEIIPMEFNASRFRPSRDEPELILAVGRDISERKAAEQRLRENDQKYRLLIENVPAAIWMGNKEEGLTYISPNAERVCGFNAEKIMSNDKKFWLSRIHKDDRSLFTVSIENLFKNGVPAENRFRFKNADENWIWLQTQLSVSQSDIYEPAVYGVVTDITEQMNITEKLHQTEKMHAIGQLAGGIAHDFNNQLTIILGSTELLLLEFGDLERVSRFAKEIRKASLYAAELTGQLLTYARKGNYKTIPIDIHRMIEDVAALLHRSLDKRIDIRHDLDAKHPLIVGDPTQMQNALINLSLNARDAMPDGGKLRFETTEIIWDRESKKSNVPASLTPGKYIHLRVKDTGTGMDEATKRRIFDPFFTTKPEGKGTGMGLAMVIGCIKSHHGEITVTTAPQQGTAMDIYLPVASSNLCQKLTSCTTVPPSLNKRQGNILLVDDESMVCRITANILKSFGFDVHCCTDGRDAVNQYIAEKNRFDLVILDLLMPNFNGQQTLSALRRMDNDIKVLISTGCEHDEQVERMMKQGAMSYIQKPFSPEELVRKVDETLQAV